MTTKADVLKVLQDYQALLSLNAESEDSAVNAKFQAQLQAAQVKHDTEITAIDQAYNDAVAAAAAARDNAVQDASNALIQSQADIASQQLIEQQAVEANRKGELDAVTGAIAYTTDRLPADAA